MPIYCLEPDLHFEAKVEINRNLLAKEPSHWQAIITHK